MNDQKVLFSQEKERKEGTVVTGWFSVIGSVCGGRRAPLSSECSAEKLTGGERPAFTVLSTQRIPGKSLDYLEGLLGDTERLWPKVLFSFICLVENIAVFKGSRGGVDAFGTLNL